MLHFPSLLAIKAGSSARVSLIPDVIYIINVTISPTAVYHYSTVIVQAHTQKNVLTLASQHMSVVNGSHVGLVELLTAGVSKLQDYYILCYPHGNDDSDVAVLIVAQLLANKGSPFVCVCVCVRVRACVCVFGRVYYHVSVTMHISVCISAHAFMHYSA